MQLRAKRDIIVIVLVAPVASNALQVQSHRCLKVTAVGQLPVRMGKVPIQRHGQSHVGRHVGAGVGDWNGQVAGGLPVIAKDATNGGSAHVCLIHGLPKAEELCRAANLGIIPSYAAIVSVKQGAKRVPTRRTGAAKRQARSKRF